VLSRCEGTDHKQLEFPESSTNFEPRDVRIWKTPETFTEKNVTQLQRSAQKFAAFSPERRA